jgi:hypothetical protein
MESSTPRRAREGKIMEGGSSHWWVPPYSREVHQKFQQVDEKRSPFRAKRCVMPYGRSTFRSRILAWPEGQSAISATRSKPARS